MKFSEIKRLFHLIDELTVSIETSEDDEIYSLKGEVENLYNKIDKLYVRELKNRDREDLGE